MADASNEEPDAQGGGDAGGGEGRGGDHRRAAKFWAVGSVIVAIIWFVGLASMIAVFLGLSARLELGRWDDPSCKRFQRVADVGIGLGMLGMLLGFFVALDVV